jgi:hypothetical protein
MHTLISGVVKPASGDLVLARVDSVHKQKRLELTDGRKALLFAGDEIIVCYGNRYAPDQYEAVIGNDLSSCDLIAAGGVAAQELSRNLRMLEPTHITPIGLVGDPDGKPLNVRSFAVPDHENAPAIPSILSLGTSMNAGKTLTATSLVRGLKRAGYRVAAIKATGTGAGNDMWIVRDAGADVALDFTDAGYSGTYLIPQSEIEAATRRLIAHAASLGCDIAVVEIADGLQHLETSALIEAKHLWEQTIGVVFAAYDAMGAKCGVDLLQALGHRVLAISGRIALSPLAMREAERATSLRVYTPLDLQEGALVPAITSCVQETEMRSAATADGSSILRPSDRPVGLQELATMRMPESGPAAAPDRAQQASVLPFPSPDARGLTLRPVDGPPEDVQRRLLATIAEWVMAAEVNAICSAPIGARTTGRTNRRNGYRWRVWTTWLGEVRVQVPRLRRGAYRPGFLAHGADAANVAAIAAAAFFPNAPLSALSRLLTVLEMPALPVPELAALQADLRGKQGIIRVPLGGTLAGTGGVVPDLARESAARTHWGGNLGVAGTEDDDEDEGPHYSSLRDADRRGSVQLCGFDTDPYAD